ncbi:MAG: TraY domain-containing protein [Burkholderiaceae bacterium]
MLALRLPVEIEQRLDALAKATGRTKTFYAREAILQHLDDLEDRYLAECELEALRAGRSTSLPLAEVMKQHGMER